MTIYKVIWSIPALQDLFEIQSYIFMESPQNATMVYETLFALGNSLETFPEAHPIDPFLRKKPKAYRFIPKWNYKIIYSIDTRNSTVIIDMVFGTPQDTSKLIKSI